MKFLNNLKLNIYLPGFIISTILATWFWLQSEYSLTWLVILILAVLANHFLMVNGLLGLIGAIKSQGKPSVAKTLTYLMGKTLVIGVAMFLVLRYAPKNIYIALILFIFQLIILLISIKKEPQKA